MDEQRWRDAGCPTLETCLDEMARLKHELHELQRAYACLRAACTEQAAVICMDVHDVDPPREHDFDRGLKFGARECAAQIRADGLTDVEPCSDYDAALASAQMRADHHRRMSAWQERLRRSLEAEQKGAFREVALARALFEQHRSEQAIVLAAFEELHQNTRDVWIGRATQTIALYVEHAQEN